MTPVTAVEKGVKFDPKTFLSTIESGRKIADFSKKQKIFVQGDSSDAVFYIQKGKVKLTVVSKSGKEATIAVTANTPNRMHLRCWSAATPT